MSNLPLSVQWAIERRNRPTPEPMLDEDEREWSEQTVTPKQLREMIGPELRKYGLEWMMKYHDEQGD